ncbi:ABC transporter permease, partial [Streptosporangium algeriense]
VATATVAAFVGLGGLGRYVVDGFATNDYPRTLAGAVLVGLVALFVQFVFVLIQRLVVSPGVRRPKAVR